MKNLKIVYRTKNKNISKSTTNQMVGTCTRKAQNAQNDIQQETSEKKEEGQASEKMVQKRSAYGWENVTEAMDRRESRKCY